MSDTFGILKNNLDRASDIVEDVETMPGWKDNPSLLGIRAVAQHMVASLGAIVEGMCPGHVASATDAKICGRCGVHVDALR